MNNTNDSNEKQDDRILSLTAFALFLGGLLLLPIGLLLHLSEEMGEAGMFFAELLALILGVISRRRRLGKIAAIGSGIYFLIAIAAGILLVCLSPPR